MHLPAYLILCIFSGILALIRMWVTDSIDLSSLLWNLILAFLPYIFALAYTTWKGKIRWISFLFWIVFLPNSFYILTDFVHLTEYPEMIYYDIVYISAMAFAGMISGYASMELIHHEWNIHYHKRIAWILMTTIVCISMVGVYIGRFLRFNSWDMLHNPLNFVRETWILLSSNGKIWNITDLGRLTESHLFEVGAMGLWQFVLLYGSFFLLVYVYIYHAKKK